MSIADNKLTARRLLEEVVNTGNVDHVADFISPDCRDSATGQIIGVEGMRAHIIGVRETYPDLHLTVEQQIAEGEWVATRVTARGTHLGEWLGMRPTGKQVTITGVNLNRVIDGRIVEHGGAANVFEALLAVGAIRTVGNEGR
ncbi:MAG: ester cyclase [Firmicutes bacterium]|nr:ester cyclase [Bacillota bacterium]